LKIAKLCNPADREKTETDSYPYIKNIVKQVENTTDNNIAIIMETALQQVYGFSALRRVCD
jgi:hypothetical protein